MKERRIGRVVVHARLLNEAINGGGGANLFKDAIPLDIQREWIADRITYLLWHPAFDCINEGEIAPEYTAIFSQTSPYPTWARVEGRTP